MRLYFDGVDVASTTASPGGAVAPTVSNAIRLGAGFPGFDALRGKIDNIKMLNTDKTDFSDRFVEGDVVDRYSNIFRNPDNSLQLLCLMGTDTHIEQPEVGEPGVITGAVSVVDVKFRKGFDVTADSKLIDFPVSVGQKGTLEFYLKPHFDDTDAVNRYLIDTSDTLAVRLFVLWTGSELFFGAPGAFAGTSGLTFAAESVNHVACVWDDSGIGTSSDQVRLYFNRVLVASNTASLPTIDQPDFRVGNISLNNLNANSAIDNLKVYNYPNVHGVFPETEYPNLMNDSFPLIARS